MTSGNPAPDRLPSHQANCFGCGSGNECGLGIRFDRAEDGIRGTLVLDKRHEGAPGLAHGGIVATVLDEAAGMALMPLRLPAVTAQLNVTFCAPIPLGKPLLVTARLDHREGRKLHIAAHIELDGRTAAQAQALYIEVAPDHFHAHGAEPGDLPGLGI
ncbi:PaaI family thioesterase [Nocardia transvalensis]|uniref:PaaI family thioesterase n=1 Tax=Nocardia transvalensis TaxID=37333 RepID=UPI0018956DCA|nr:PaaI family thioesterase [Nocardia transvalensis]MBF6332864.1 PaaI family thioesterase [Nocardia transvalensis]